MIDKIELRQPKPGQQTSKHVAFGLTVTRACRVGGTFRIALRNSDATDDSELVWLPNAYRLPAKSEGQGPVILMQTVYAPAEALVDLLERWREVDVLLISDPRTAAEHPEVSATLSGGIEVRLVPVWTGNRRWYPQGSRPSSPPLPGTAIHTDRLPALPEGNG